MKPGPSRGRLSTLLLQVVIGAGLLAPPLARAAPSEDAPLVEHRLTAAIAHMPCSACPLAPGFTPANAGGVDGHDTSPSSAIVRIRRFGALQTWALTSATRPSTRIHLLYCRWLN